jgi:hypothetical protein
MKNSDVTVAFASENAQNDQALRKTVWSARERLFNAVSR